MPVVVCTNLPTMAQPFRDKARGIVLKILRYLIRLITQLKWDRKSQTPEVISATISQCKQESDEILRIR